MIFSELGIFLLSTPQVDDNIKLRFFPPDMKKTYISFSFSVSRQAASSLYLTQNAEYILIISVLFE